MACAATHVQSRISSQHSLRGGKLCASKCVGVDVVLPRLHDRLPVSLKSTHANEVLPYVLDMGGGAATAASACRHANTHMPAATTAGLTCGNVGERVEEM